MPRKSKELAIVRPLPEVPRLRMPKGLAPAVAEVWREIVLGAPAGFFVSTDAALLEAYAAAVVRAREARAALELHGPVIGSNRSGQPLMNPWASILAQAERSLATMARALRLTVQAREHPRTAGRAMTGGSPPSPYDLMRGGRGG